MKLGVSITAFNEKDIVKAIKQYEGIADRIVVTVSEDPWYGDYTPDDTAIKCVMETSAIVCRQSWEKEHEQRNFAMDLMRDMDYVITSHADTFFTRSALRVLKNLELTDLHYGCTVYMYWKDYESVVFPYIGLPTLIVRSDAVFTHLLNIEHQLAAPKELPIICYHLSWVKTDEEVKQKLASYSHANEIVDGWYRNVWKKWTPDMTNFGPTEPKDYQSIVKHPLPEEIRRLLK